LLTIARETGGAWSEPLHVGRFGNSSSTTGVALKISKDIEGLYDGAPLQILGYTLAGDRVWYVFAPLSCQLPSCPSVSASPGCAVQPRVARHGKAWQGMAKHGY
jgi:hypothetical protein